MGVVERMAQRRAIVRQALQQFRSLPHVIQGQLRAEYERADEEAAEIVRRGQSLRPEVS